MIGEMVNSEEKHDDHLPGVLNFLYTVSLCLIWNGNKLCCDVSLGISETIDLRVGGMIMMGDCDDLIGKTAVS